MNAEKLLEGFRIAAQCLGPLAVIMERRQTNAAKIHQLADGLELAARKLREAVDS